VFMMAVFIVQEYITSADRGDRGNGVLP